MASSHDADTEGITRRKSLSALAGAGALALAGCTQSTGGGSGDALSGSINIAGSSTVFPLMSAIGEDFAAEHDQVSVDISSTGSGGGFSNYFCVGDTDFNNASRPIQPAEEELCEENGVEYVELIAATDALTIVVNPEADWIDSLTVEELAQIWEEDPAQTWDEVRDEFPNEEIERFGAADTSGTYDYFIESILEERGHTSDYQATEQDNSIAQGVSGSEYAIGYFGFAYYFQNPDQLKALGIDDGNGPVEPSLETASSGEYTPLSRPLFTYPSIESLGKEHVAEFARYFVEQTTNEDLVAGDVGYVPATEETQEEQMEILEDAIERAQE
ncbi:PstS family phosphate ABC transporter substrate-binding protein [Halorubrum lacusprofundi]|jgi:phosphate transport system substrate-binding protein|uniref:Phosphate binding protein n=1 Tax=Halorubrum lacusprofundi (strain ATCC 49239 / DSM 5036 / JCM 8891 / ACAM 34) TaxID=416348 RepID=B9LT39_HALLT|nr:PstS family phosphate ABC transporter substrate-binding protein [Halorubrum lacusprofundi]ACM56104.1 phosphate binding protein [Halorubrum lacusprofundi ATCC 49239]MCG1005585.1 PstS family phosphate ABC transporter substrate-binding protein [Halorubrum lacusprofundi]